jgi:two-component system sensor histidine kinase DesK
MVSSNRRVPEVDLDRVDDKGPGPGPFYFWLILAVWPARDVFDGKSHPAWLAVGALLLCAALYVGVVWSSFTARVSLRTARWLLAALTVLIAVSAYGFGGRWFVLFPMLGVPCGVVVGHLVNRTGELAMVVVIGGVSCLAALVTWAAGASGGDIWSAFYGSGTAGVVTGVILRLATVVSVLKQTREELARTAVTEERLRFARDLHDLLGHTLSLMVVKAQAVRRLATRDPALAAEQAADIETVGRQALTEIRQAVTGYRGRGLAAELDGARTALTDAGISPIIRQEGPPLPPEGDALLGWVVREGITNVIRHSGARNCEIDVRHDGGTATVEIRDDGTGEPSAGPWGGPSTGHGLDGLAERMAAAEGTLDAAPRRGGGFRLQATLPIEPSTAARHQKTPDHAC